MKLNNNNLEQKYQKQVKDIQDSHRRIYTELINNNKELEQNFLKQGLANNKEKNDLIDKLNSLQKKYDDLTNSYEQEKKLNQKQISLLTKENDSFKSNLSSTDQNMKTKIARLESDLLEKTAQYEKDQILWESKIKFIQQERDNLKKENSESQKRFESMLDTIQKKSNAEKASVEDNMRLNINNLEQKYQKQVKDIQDSHRRIYTELINNNKELEKEIKALRLENETNKNKKTNNTELNKKMEEINQEKEKYKKMEDSLKIEKDKQIKELNAKNSQEKEALKKKIAEIEKKI